MFEGWVGTTLCDDDNAVLSDFVDDLRTSHPEAVIPPMEPLAHARNAVATVPEDIVLSDILTPAGVKVGLERIRASPPPQEARAPRSRSDPTTTADTRGPTSWCSAALIDGDLVMEGRYDPPLHIITGKGSRQ